MAKCPVCNQTLWFWQSAKYVKADAESERWTVTADSHVHSRCVGASGRVMLSAAEAKLAEIESADPGDVVDMGRHGMQAFPR